jgi:GTPase SAR1 family protein
VIVYDATDRQSFEEVTRYWMEEVKLYAKDLKYVLVLGNKVDQENQMVVDPTDGHVIINFNFHKQL